MTLTNRRLLWLLAVEEYRSHARLFGGRRFALFPAFVALVAAASATFFALAATDTGTIVAGLHAVVAVLGLQVGTVGLEGRDALEDLFGERTLLLFASWTLPIEPKRVLVAFLLKDVLYYGVLFLLPLSVGLVPLAVLGELSVVELPLVFLTTAATFALGVAASVALVGVYVRSRLVALGIVGTVAVAIALAGQNVLAITPYGLLEAPRTAAVVGTVALPLVFGTIGVALFEFDRDDPDRTAVDRFGALSARFGSYDSHGIAAKSLLDVARSSGGLWKAVFSQGLVFIVIVMLLAALPDVVRIRPSPGLTIAAVLALGSFTAYNWLCQFDDSRFYARYPVSHEAVFRGKLLAFSLLNLPIGVSYLAAGTALFGSETILLGVAVFPPLSLYVFGITVYFAGLRPSELLFDTPVFAAFTAATMLVLLPIVVAAIAIPLAPTAIGAGSVALAGVAGAVGYVLYRRAGERWERRSRSGNYRSSP